MKGEVNVSPRVASWDIKISSRPLLVCHLEEESGESGEKKRFREKNVGLVTGGGVRIGRPVGARWRSPVRGSARCP